MLQSEISQYFLLYFTKNREFKRLHWEKWAKGNQFPMKDGSTNVHSERTVAT